MRKIALIGKEPASQGLAPWGDPSWEMWTCSLDASRWPRCDLHFEVHNLDIAKRGTNRTYLDFVKKQKGLIVAYRDLVRMPHGEPYPIREVLARFGPYHLTSSHALMFAMAILEIEELPPEERKKSVIGFWGIDMQSNEEYRGQRPGFQHFITEANRVGIPLGSPPQSDILQPPPVYGFEMFDPFWIKLYAYLLQTNSDIQKEQEKLQSAQMRLMGLQGARERIDYDMNTWAGRFNASLGSSSEDQEGSGIPDRS